MFSPKHVTMFQQQKENWVNSVSFIVNNSIPMGWFQGFFDFPTYLPLDFSVCKTQKEYFQNC